MRNILKHSRLVLATLEIETPATANVISNYVPADAIVIPASANGNVQIIFESSPDLVNWTAATRKLRSISRNKQIFQGSRGSKSLNFLQLKFVHCAFRSVNFN